jgi:putative ABC transport system substrate-binding protein
VAQGRQSRAAQINGLAVTSIALLMTPQDVTKSILWDPDNVVETRRNIEAPDENVAGLHTISDDGPPHSTSVPIKPNMEEQPHMVRHRHAARWLLTILRVLPGHGCMDAMRAGVAAIFLALLFIPMAAAGEKPYRIGVVLPGDQWASGVDGLKEGMRGLGYVEGRDIHYLLENAAGDKAKIEETTRKYVAEKVDVVYTITNTALKIVAQVTKPSKTPVVFGSASGPVESGIMPSYATPDAYVTGVTSASIELVPNRLEILKEVLPHVKRVALIGDRHADSSIASFKVARDIAPELDLTLIEIVVTSKEEAVQAAQHITPKEADALFLIPSLNTVGVAGEIADAARAARLPFAVYQVEHVQQHGALLSYGSSYFLQGKQAASLVDKVLRGVPLAGLPIERPRLHQLTLNLDTAREIGVAFAPDVLNRADQLIDSRSQR